MKNLENKTAAVNYFYNYINEGEELVTREEIEKAMTFKNTHYSLFMNDIEGMTSTDYEEMKFVCE
ncbi:MAG: hypothetical protein A2W90_02540 [Bacteroidetes bacterium GWF2_42_66]|nr:MAG: hypothetical protein A2W92_16170 [Bacteroidetes bacterium GWA2_42_15]OFY01229.1 MAG: hypothetical protein A2W89_16025 [Bacteroidetes bacterium GWE2_42_39]OFY42072.1 MAG: hypothetical protein A2W90_02540 [Bacteroidetes bacterium GWF2_42_66]HBL77725.1 hypothetical protein [Prolixibacteraceae bacterium]